MHKSINKLISAKQFPCFFRYKFAWIALIQYSTDDRAFKYCPASNNPKEKKMSEPATVIHMDGVKAAASSSYATALTTTGDAATEGGDSRKGRELPLILRFDGGGFRSDDEWRAKKGASL
jgi:hypothetical protein